MTKSKTAWFGEMRMKLDDEQCGRNNKNEKKKFNSCIKNIKEILRRQYRVSKYGKLKNTKKQERTQSLPK